MIADVWNYEIYAYLVKFFIVFDVKDGTESEYPSIVFLSIFIKVQDGPFKKSIMVINRNFFFIHKKVGGVLPCSP